MAVHSLGDRTPASLPSPLPAANATPFRVQASSRTRRNHGAFLVGNELATVCSSRREADGLGVLLQVGHGSLILSGAMTPTQARAMARALMAAAHAADATLQRTALRPVQEGGAA